MRGSDERTGSLFSFVDLEERVPRRHPLRKIRQVVNDALAALDADFSKLYASEGRPSIAPEKLLRASLLQAFFSVRSERQLMEQLDFNLLFRWFVGLGIDDPVWDATVFTKNRNRLLDADVAAKFMAAVLAHREIKPLLSSDHFSVDGTLPEDAIHQLTPFTARLSGKDRRDYEKELQRESWENEAVKYGSVKKRLARQEAKIRAAKRKTRGIKALNPFIALGLIKKK